MNQIKAFFTEYKIVIGIVVASLVIFGGGWFLYGAHVQNNAIHLENQVEASESQIQAVLQKRVDSLSQLIQTAQEGSQFEQDALNKIIEARSKTAAGDVAGANLAINAVAEKYPELKSVALFSNVQTQSTLVENQLNAARNANTNDIRQYKNYVKSWPHNSILDSKGYEVKNYEPFKANSSATGYDPTTQNLWKNQQKDNK